MDDQDVSAQSDWASDGRSKVFFAVTTAVCLLLLVLFNFALRSRDYAKTLASGGPSKACQCAEARDRPRLITTTA